ncbi:uncharacterized protein [Diadema antillarum]|uniref:uncharacterized protein n=1 Tax=Diadema antillarum TaxID=105358 RepID=UPI003A8873E2
MRSCAVELEGYICSKCTAKYTKKLKNPTYTPKKHRKKERTDCFLSYYDICSNTSQRDCHCSIETFNTCFSVESNSIPDAIPLCMKHRSQLSHFRNWDSCSVCENNLKSEDKRYSCSSIIDIDMDRLLNINDNLTLNEDSILCSPCYRYCLKHMNKPASSIDELQDMLQKEAEQYAEADQETVQLKVMCAVFLYVCKLCKDDGCFLFVKVYDYYVSEIKKLCKENVNHHNIQKSPSYVNGRIIHKFGDLLHSNRIARKHGLFYYPSNLSHDDILNAWHLSHSKLHMIQRSEGSDDVEMTEGEFQLSADTQSDVNTQFRNITSHCNDSLRKQGKRITSAFVSNPMSLAEFEFQTAYKLFNPLIWNIVCMITASTEETKFFRQSDIDICKEYIQFPSEEGHSYHRKKQRRAVAIFLLQLVMHDDNNYPLQIIVANCVKRMSHSTKLLRILNHIGFACSESTLDRFLQDIHDKRTESGPLNELKPSAFTIVSIDNIDVLTPYAAVTVDKTRSWHGTSIMAQQPKPKSERFHEHEQLRENSFTTPSVEKSQTQSFVPVKKPKVRRRLAELDDLVAPHHQTFDIPVFSTSIKAQLDEQHFLLTDSEIKAELSVYKEAFSYVVERFYYVRNNISSVIPSFKCKLALQHLKEVEKSKFSYMYILNEKADSPETMKRSLGLLYDSFKVGKDINHLIVVGDGATIRLLVNLKNEFRESLDWVIPYLGDWHVLKNYQEVLMKVFWDAGLKDVAKITHKQSTLSSLGNCSNFKRTHQFLLQVFEAIFMVQLSCFLSYKGRRCDGFSEEEFIQKVGKVVSCLRREDGVYRGVSEFLKQQRNFQAQILNALHDEFLVFCKEMSAKLETFRFWHRFLTRDCLCYINLHLAIRTGNWNLRIAALKSMAPIFHAFDRQNYSFLIPLHLSTIYSFPEYVIEHLRKGAFVSSVTGTNFSMVAWDEGHEMLINKDCKNSFSGHLPQHVEKTCATLEFQAKIVSNFEQQTDTQRQHLYQRDLQRSVVENEFLNVRSYFNALFDTSIFSDTPSHSSLYHIFSKVEANPVQQRGLLCYRELGQEAYESLYKAQILQETSQKKPVMRKFKLKTFAKENVRARKISDLEKEKRMITKCYKHAMAFSLEKKRPISELGQCVESPRAICTIDGLPYKGAKSVVYDYFGKRYTAADYKLIDNCAPFSDNSSVCVILEGMNIIHSSPLHQFKIFKEYVDFLCRRYIGFYFRRGYKEVRVLFDQYNTQGISPKYLERMRREKGNTNEPPAYESIDDNAPLPKNWEKFLKHRPNKHKLCRYLSQQFIHRVRSYLQNESQIFITSGGFHVGLGDPGEQEWSGFVVTYRGVSKHNIVHNHEESDTQIWLHVFDTSCYNILIYSVDRDIGMIGLPLDFGKKKIVIQYRANNCDEKYLDLSTFQSACLKDADLGRLIAKNIDVKKCLQVVYVCSGCDFVSFFVRKGKSLFFKTFFQYITFITGGESPKSPGQLSQTILNENSNNGLLAFYRLVMCVYFMANRVCLHDYDSPVELFHSVVADSVLEQHSEALDIVRRASWKVGYEDELLPSDEALRLHWLRSCWVSSVWDSVKQEKFMYPDVRKYGFKVSNVEGETVVSMEWDSADNVRKIKENVLYLTRGCSCAKSKCLIRQCKCRKNSNFCGPGCRCRHCENTEAAVATRPTADVTLADSLSGMSEIEFSVNERAAHSEKRFMMMSDSYDEDVLSEIEEDIRVTESDDSDNDDF